MTDETTAMIRLDRLLSQATDLSRKQAKQVIRKGEVSLDESVVKDPGLLVPQAAVLVWRGEYLGLPGPVYLMMHKPLGVVCARSDPDHTTVLDLLPEGLAERVHIVGRLDKDTTGLLLLTDDGDWSHRISSPRHACAKHYRAQLADPLPEHALARFAEGLLLRGDAKPTKPARIEQIDTKEALVVISEGRYHQVRRMFAAVGNRVERLHREQIGNLCLDPALAPGRWRELTERERNDLVELN